MLSPGGYDADARQDYDIDAAILAAAFGRVVAGDRVKFGIAGGGEPGRREVIVEDEDFGQFRSARSG